MGVYLAMTNVKGRPNEVRPLDRFELVPANDSKRTKMSRPFKLLDLLLTI